MQLEYPTGIQVTHSNYTGTHSPSGLQVRATPTHTSLPFRHTPPAALALTLPDNPAPTPDQMRQLINWFTNNRKRFWKPTMNHMSEHVRPAWYTAWYTAWCAAAVRALNRSLARPRADPGCYSLDRVGCCFTRK